LPLNRNLSWQHLHLQILNQILCLCVPRVPAIVPPPDNLVIAKLKNCQRGQAKASTSAAAEVAVSAAASVDVAVASSGLTYVRNLAPDCWVLLRANTADSAGAAVAALAAAGKWHCQILGAG
jgi:hypothetical protein